MDFVFDNYLWFVVGAIVLLMIVIGYFAEKTNFGKEPLKSKKEKKEATNIEQPSEEKVDIVEEATENINADEMTTIPEEISEPLKEEVSDFNIPEEDLNVPFGDQNVETQVEVLPVDESVNDVPEVPDVPEISDNGISDESEDDVWKF